MARETISPESVYHVYNRGVEKRTIFQEDGDRLRFMHYLYHLNNSGSRDTNLSRNLETQMKQVGPASFEKMGRRERLVDIFAFVLMPNHYHLMIQESSPGGISAFMQRLGTGYTMFFNEKYRRSGALFQGKYKYKELQTEAHFLYLPHYIHMNPISLLGDEAGPTCFNRLVKYRWCSLPNYVGGRSFSSVINTDLILDTFGGTSGYVKDFGDCYENKTSLEDIEDIAIDWVEG